MTKLKNFLILIWKNFVHWVRTNNGSTRDFVFKVIIAVFVYIIISDVIKKLFIKLEKIISKGERPGKVSHFFLGLLKHLILIGVVYELGIRLSSVEVNPLVTITASSCIVIILVIQGALVKLVSNAMQSLMRLFKNDDAYNIDSTVLHLPKLSNAGSLGVILEFFLKIVRKVIGLGIAVVIVYIIYQGIFYLTDSGGFEVARMLNMSEKEIAKELDTSFHEDDSLAKAVTEFPDEGTKVFTDGNLNIIYENNVRVGINTSSRKYKFYGIGINQPNIQNTKRMAYNYDGIVQRTEDVAGGKSNTYYYYNRGKNDCLAITINNSSNRVVNMTYYNDFSRIEGNLNYIVDDGD